MRQEQQIVQRNKYNRKSLALQKYNPHKWICKGTLSEGFLGDGGRITEPVL